MTPLTVAELNNIDGGDLNSDAAVAAMLTLAAGAGALASGGLLLIALGIGAALIASGEL